MSYENFRAFRTVGKFEKTFRSVLQICKWIFWRWLLLEKFANFSLNTTKHPVVYGFQKASNIVYNFEKASKISESVTNSQRKLWKRFANFKIF